MKENIKTFILLFLIGLSLFFTRQLWLQSPDEVIDLVRSRMVVAEEKKDEYTLAKMLSPEKFLINFNSENQTIIYDDSSYGLWENSKIIFNELFTSKNIEIKEISKKEYEQYLTRRSIVFYFPEERSSYIFARSLEVKKPNEIVDKIPIMEKIYFNLGTKDHFFVFSNKDKLIKVTIDSLDVDYIKEVSSKVNIIEDSNFPYYYSMKDTLAISNDIYIPYEVNYILPRIYVENKVVNLNNNERIKLAENFLSRDIDHIREIVEENRSTIYLYNQEVLKINIDGTIEYFNPLIEDIKERNLYQSLLTASSFISEKAKSQKGIYLSRVEEIEIEGSLGYELIFRYRVRGVPVILGNNQVKDYLQIEVFNDHIRSYKYYDRKDMNKITTNTIDDKKEVIAAFDVIDMNYNLIKNRYIAANEIDINEEDKSDMVDQVLSSIDEVSLAYFDPCLKDREEELIPVWIIRIRNNTLAFNVYNGSLVYSK